MSSTFRYQSLSLLNGAQKKEANSYGYYDDEIEDAKRSSSIFSCLPSFCMPRITAAEGWTTSKEIEIKVDSSEVFPFFSKASEWPTWDDGLVSSQLDEPSKVEDGSEGTLVMKERGMFRFILQGLDEDAQFGYSVELTGASSYWFWKWANNEDTDDLHLEMGVTIEGPLTFLYKLWIEKEVVEAFERSLATIKTLLEQEK